MADKVVLSVGTKRGLFLMESGSGRQRWKITGPLLKGWPIYHALIDTRGTPRLHVSASSHVYASTAFSSDASGRKLKAATRPPAPPALTAKQRKMCQQWGCSTAERMWIIEPGPARQKRVLYAGTAPAGLFRSEDSGQTWDPIPALNGHRSRKDWSPGFGGMSLHSIQVDAHDPDRMWVAISAAGVFRTEDGGGSWKPINEAVAKHVGAPEDSKIGTCVHKLLAHPAVPGRLYQQNHVGVYRSDDHGDTWYRIDGGLPYDFGFGLALDPHDAETCFVVPLEPEEYAFRATDGALRVYRLNRNGRSWKKLTRGLPSKNAYLSVLRQAMASDPLSPCGVYMGTGGGQIFASADRGDSWQAIAEYLPPVYSVHAAVI